MKILLKNKRISIITALALGELAALVLLAFSLTSTSVSTAASANVSPPKATLPEPSLDLQFLRPKSFEDYRLAMDRNPFSGPVRRVFVQQEPPPQQVKQPRIPQLPIIPPPPKPKIEITYNGMMTAADGKPAALIDDALQKKQRFFGIGDELYFFKISDFNDEKLFLQRSDGMVVEVWRKLPTIIGELER